MWLFLGVLDWLQNDPFMTRSRNNNPPDDENDLPSGPAFEIKQSDIVWIECDPEEDHDEASW